MDQNGFKLHLQRESLSETENAGRKQKRSKTNRIRNAERSSEETEDYRKERKPSLERQNRERQQTKRYQVKILEIREEQ